MCVGRSGTPPALVPLSSLALFNLHLHRLCMAPLSVKRNLRRCVAHAHTCCFLAAAVTAFSSTSSRRLGRANTRDGEAAHTYTLTHPGVQDCDRGGMRIVRPFSSSSELLQLFLIQLLACLRLQPRAQRQLKACSSRARCPSSRLEAREAPQRARACCRRPLFSLFAIMEQG